MWLQNSGVSARLSAAVTGSAHPDSAQVLGNEGAHVDHRHLQDARHARAEYWFIAPDIMTSLHSPTCRLVPASLVSTQADGGLAVDIRVHSAGSPLAFVRQGGGS